jgi:solute carrier family 25 S-adenosylmethionine transporter 26
LERLIPVLVALLMMPMDVVMTRLMTQSSTGQYKGLLDCLLTIVKDEGLTALFRGIGPRFMTLVLGPEGPLSLARLASVDI